MESEDRTRSVAPSKTLDLTLCYTSGSRVWVRLQV